MNGIEAYNKDIFTRTNTVLFFKMRVMQEFIINRMQRYSRLKLEDGSNLKHLSFKSVSLNGNI